MHPGVGDLTHLTENELEEKILQLNRYYFTASNDQVRQQIILLLDDYKLEMENRRIEAKKRQQENSENGESGLDGLINIS